MIRAETTRWDRLESLFHEALEQPRHARDGFLTARCAEDPALRDELTGLLAAHEAADPGFDAPPSVGAATAITSRPFAAGRVIGRYRIVRLIGAGGMGAVYEAVQDSPARTVALKALTAVSADAARRLEQEALLLGRLRHPGIAQVYDAGVLSADDRAGPVPFIAMELVPDARPLARYADEAGLDTRARLELLARVCDAAQHAHTRDVIHRDLKPANILVDPSGNPQIIDFGVARVLGDRPAGAHTGAHTLLGTMAYMSPEQCEAPADADVRTDVYSLGVVLYELLCGVLPYAVDGVSLSAATRIIREAAPRRLSAVRPMLRGDLETITLKALEKDRDRRYQSVADLAADIRRYLSRRPIAARPPSLAYLVMKLVSRNGLASALAAGALVGAIVFTVSVTILYARADSARIRAQTAERDALDQRNRARAGGAELVAMLRELDSGTGSTLFSADRPEEAQQNPLEILDRSAQSLDHLLGDDPIAHADALMVLAMQYNRHNAPERAYSAAAAALELRRRALGGRHVSTAETLAFLTGLADRVSSPGNAEEYGREAVAIYESHLPGRAADAIRSLTQLARLYRAHGDPAGSAEAHRRAYELATRAFGAEDPRTADAGMRHAGALIDAGRPEGHALYERCVGLLRSAFGGDDLRTLRAEAGLLRARGDARGWDEVMQRILAKRRDELGPDRPEVADDLVSLAVGRFAMGMASEAMAAHTEALELRRRLFGDRSLKVAESLGALAFLHHLSGQTARAEECQRGALSICRAHLGDDHIDTAGQALLLSTPMGSRSGAPHTELLAHARGYYGRTRSLPADHPAHSGAPLLLGMALLQQGLDAEAEPVLREALEIRLRTFTPGHPMTAYAAGVLAACRARLGDCEEGIPAIIAARAGLQGPRNLRSIELTRWLIETYELCGQPDAAQAEREGLARLFPAGAAPR
ncbi:MAG: protein kinase domain-containing protein [Phycisphaerales bacterium]